MLCTKQKGFWRRFLVCDAGPIYKLKGMARSPSTLLRGGGGGGARTSCSSSTAIGAPGRRCGKSAAVTAPAKLFKGWCPGRSHTLCGLSMVGNTKRSGRLVRISAISRPISHFLGGPRAPFVSAAEERYGYAMGCPLTSPLLADSPTFRKDRDRKLTAAFHHFRIDRWNCRARVRMMENSFDTRPFLVFPPAANLRQEDRPP